MTEHPETSSGLPRSLRNFIIAGVAVILAIALFIGLNTETGEANLEVQAEQATPLEVALDNSKPTFLEFYANWCTSCQAMAQELQTLKNEYGESVNFVMLNVDNTKWLPEILQYRVDGIPHFVYLDGDGKAIAQTIGEQPKSVLEADLQALIAEKPLPYANATGQTSAFQAKVKPKNDDPRNHGG
ncbi:thioredoxin family protein [Spirulina sp. CS-785/01]|uniref:thioredoxin family protein n=1 Tax=Spirulina sp. CS-785/01 TaxID=3021716 RepID=UPI00232D902C|nr:thioredoxin family protein [Spirulina sp. CS-785/01]MDB9315750.1 thioredoxin family protein [Spirulina sp. CS-785/01]